MQGTGMAKHRKSYFRRIAENRQMYLFLILPLIWLIYLGIRFIFGFKAPSWKPGLVIIVLWLVVVAVLAALCFFGAFSTNIMSV